MNLAEILNELKPISNIQELENFFQKYLGKKGQLNAEFGKMKDASPEEKKELGAKLSELKNNLTKAYSKKENELSIIEINKQLGQDIVDISVNAKKYEGGHYNLLSKTRRDLEKIAQNMGFTIDYGHEVVTKYENFASVNIPLSHPATEMHDTIYLNEQSPDGENFVLRTHNSAHQVQDMQKYGVPLKLVSPGRCYRFDDMDATHDTMFQYIEGMYIDKNVSIAHFKSYMTTLLSAIIGRKVETRFRPCHFPFVEPGFEIDARYDIIDSKTGETSKSKRMELLGAGMIHPNVMKEGGIDPNQRSGFAFGIGISRLAAVKYGIKDIRYFTNGDLRFIKSF
ncbi:MAG TPA: phenylalanine--tRNA ligase subunit alpha [Candidatus Absconditabacterales bacterium]|nr:phenylalanine--tRNA ligase subunit alpha [Candidatus Absconditabacterales bacterium]